MLRAHLVWLRGPVCVLALLAADVRTHAADEWVEVVTPNFRVVSNAGEGRARNIGWQFEQIRAGMQAGWPWARGRLDRPFLIIAVKDENGLKLLAPQYWEAGNRVRPGSVSATGPDRHYVVIRTDLESTPTLTTNPYRHAYWTYTQTVLSDSFSGRLPFWFSRGLAAVLSNTIVTDRQVEFGHGIQSFMEELRGGRFALPDLLSMTRESPAIGREIERQRFDAQSWALVHYLIFGEANREASAQRVNELVRLMVAGMPSVDAVTKVYGAVPALDTAYRTYIDRGLLRYSQMGVDAKIARRDFQARSMPPAEALAVRVEYLVATNRPNEAKAGIAELQQGSAVPAAAYAAEGILLERARQPEQAREAFQKAAELGSTNYYVYWRLGTLQLGAGSSPEARVAARQHLTKAIELNPDSGFVYASLGSAMMQTGSVPEAVEAYRKATSLEPSEAGLRLSFATALSRAGQRDEALQEAKLALALARTDQQKLAAQSLIDRLSKGETTR